MPESRRLTTCLSSYMLISMHQRRLGLLGSAALLLFCCGCPFSPQTGVTGDLPFLDSTSNSTFDGATIITLPASDELVFESRTDTSADLDIFKLGTLSAGDQIYVDVQPASAALDLVASVFDSNEYLHVYNDDREPDSSNLNPLLDFIIRGETDTYYLAIAPYVENTTTGLYRVTVRITRDQQVPAPIPQVLYLNWAGGQNIVIPNVGTFDLDPFDAADLGPYGSQTAAMKDRIQAIVAERYEDFGLVILNSDDNVVPQGSHSTVHFGGSHAQAFAIAEQIDSLNADQSDDAIIFTESFRRAFSHTPTFEQMATAVGNTVAHEVGHLFGLVHTADCESLMDSSCGNSSILSTQEFKTAAIDSGTFPTGYQAARDILEWVLGFIGL
ncbi:MAG: reprolysin-like metallopeptidase [Planctomycetota bacterium]